MIEGGIGLVFLFPVPEGLAQRRLAFEESCDPPVPSLRRIPKLKLLSSSRSETY